MKDERIGQVAVIFVSRRRADGPPDARHAYDAAARAMEALAARQPGYRGLDSTRGDDGVGVTVSYWADDAAAIAWRDHPEHAAVRDRGRRDWYDRYEVIVTRVERDYRWSAP